MLGCLSPYKESPLFGFKNDKCLAASSAKCFLIYIALFRSMNQFLALIIPKNRDIGDTFSTLDKEPTIISFFIACGNAK